MAAKIDEMNYDRRVLSRNAEFGGTLTSGMVPWSDNGIFMAGLLGVPTLAYLPYMWLAFACIGITILYGYMNKFMWQIEAPQEDDLAEPMGALRMESGI
jgi:NhaC family Na+:H+ antiporter